MLAHIFLAGPVHEILVVSVGFFGRQLVFEILEHLPFGSPWMQMDGDYRLSNVQPYFILISNV